MNHSTKTTDNSAQTDLMSDKPHHYQTFTYTSHNPKRNYHHSRKAKKKKQKERQNQESEIADTQPTITRETLTATADNEDDTAITTGIAGMHVSKTNPPPALIPFLCPDHVIATTDSAAGFCARLDADSKIESAGAANGSGTVEADLKQAEAYFAGMRKVLDERARLCNELEGRIKELNTICSKIRSTERSGEREDMERLRREREWLVGRIRVLRARWNVCGDWI